MVGQMIEDFRVIVDRDPGFKTIEDILLTHLTWLESTVGNIFQPLKDA